MAEVAEVREWRVFSRQQAPAPFRFLSGEWAYQAPGGGISGGFATEAEAREAVDRQREYQRGVGMEAGSLPVVNSEPEYPEEESMAEDIWEFTERSRARWPAIVDLWHWSTNYDAGKGPFALFVDLIGWSADELGSAVWSGYESLGAGGAYYMSHDSSRYLGYVELEKLADALTEYVKQPQDARRFVDELMSIEGR